MDEEAILGGLRSGEDLPDYDYEDFEAGSTGQGRRGEDPGRDTPRGRGRYADDGDDRIFRQATDDEQTRRVYSDRSGSESGHRRGRFDFVSMAMDMARPHSDDPEAMPIRPPRSLVPGESQVSDEFESRPQGPGTMVLVPGGIPGRSTGSQNPGQFDEHEERKFSDFGYDDLLKSTAGWGSSSKQGSDAGRPNPNTAKSESYDDEGYNFADEEESHSRRDAGSRATARTSPAAAKFEVDDDDEYAAFADRRDEEEDQPRRNARIRDAARPRSLSRGAARDLRVDRDARSKRERARDSREVLRGLEAIHDREGPVGPPAIDDTPNVPPFPNITFGGPLNQRDVNSNRVTGSPRVTERVADVVGRGARDGRLADALGIEDRPSIASPLGRDTSDLETLRSSNEFTPQWGSTARERSASAKRPSPLAIETDRSKARRASPSPMDSTPQDEEMPDPADVHIHSTPESRASHVGPRSGDSRRRGSTPSRPSGVGDCPVDDSRRYARASGAPERIEISTPPALRSHSSGESGDARAKEVFDLHIQEMLERGEVSGSVAKAFHIFADQIRVLNGQVSSMRREWSDESRQTKDKVDRLAAEIATQSDAGRMKMIVQRFAREVIPDSKAIVRQAIDEQAEVVEQRINLLSHEVHESVRDNEASTDRLRQMIQENREAVHRSHAASEDEILKDLDKLEKRIFSIEKTVGMRTPAGVWNLNPVAHLPDRASGSMVDANFRELNLKIEKALLEHETFAKWASESIEGINEEHTRLVNRVSRLQSGRGSQEVDRPSERESPQDWHEAVDEINRKMQDLARGIQRQRRDHDDIISRFETVKSHVEQYEARSAIVNRVVDGIPASSDQMLPAVRRELGSLRSTLEGVMRRVSAIDGNVRTLSAANNRIMSQLFEMEGQFDEAAGIIQGVQQINEAPQRPREGRNVGYNAFAGQGHRIRSPTPTPGESDGRGTGLPVRSAGGRDRCTKCNRIPEPGFPLVPCVGCGMRACEVCCPMPARLCESCRITSCTPIGALISTVVDKDRFHHKCNTIVLPAEPTADKLREWLSEIKERVRNAFSFDSDYALAWISETERLDYDALGGPCKYPILDSNFTSAIRECIKTRAVRDKMNRLTEAAQNMNPPQGIKGRQILKLLLNHLQTGVEDDQTFKMAELTSLKCRQTGHSDDEARLRSYLSTWDNLISGIRKKIDDGVLLAVFIENVRHLRCMRPDIERWDRDVTVRSFAWLYKACQDCVERWQKRQNTLQMYQTFHEQRSRSGSQSRERDRHPGAPGVVRRYDPLARKSDPSPSRSVRSGRDGRPDGKPRSSSPGRSSQRDRVSPGRGSQRDKRTPSPKSPRRQSPAGPADRACWEYTKTGKCQYGRECRFEHDKSWR